MKFTVTDTEKTLQQLMDEEGYTISSQRFSNKISFWISNGTIGSQLYISGAGVRKAGLPEPLQTDTRPIEYLETATYDETSSRLDKIRMQAGAGQSVTVYVDIRA